MLDRSVERSLQGSSRPAARPRTLSRDQGLWTVCPCLIPLSHGVEYCEGTLSETCFRLTQHGLEPLMF